MFDPSLIELTLKKQNRNEFPITLCKIVLTQPDYNKSEYLLLMIAQLIMIAVLVVFLVVWHVRNMDRMNQGEEI